MVNSASGASANVVRLSDFRNGTAVRQDASCPLDVVHRSWDALRAGRLVPNRADLTPQVLKPVLDHVMVLERVSRGQVRFRVVGNHLVDLAGAPLRGLPLSSVFDSASRQLLTDVVCSVLEEPATVRLSLSTEATGTRQSHSGDMVLLPLRSDLGDVSRILAAVSVRGRLGRPPHFLRIEDVAHRTLVGYARPQREDRPGGRPPVVSRPKGHLTLVSSSD